MQNTEQNRPRGNISRTHRLAVMPHSSLKHHYLANSFWDYVKYLPALTFGPPSFPFFPPALKCCLNLKYVETLNPPRDVHMVVLKLLRAGEITQTIMAR